MVGRTGSTREPADHCVQRASRWESVE